MDSGKVVMWVIVGIRFWYVEEVGIVCKVWILILIGIDGVYCMVLCIVWWYVKNVLFKFFVSRNILVFNVISVS